MRPRAALIQFQNNTHKLKFQKGINQKNICINVYRKVHKPGGNLSIAAQHNQIHQRERWNNEIPFTNLTYDRFRDYTQFHIGRK